MDLNKGIQFSRYFERVNSLKIDKFNCFPLTTENTITVLIKQPSFRMRLRNCGVFKSKVLLKPSLERMHLTTHVFFQNESLIVTSEA